MNGELVEGDRVEGRMAVHTKNKLVISVLLAAVVLVEVCRYAEGKN